MTRSRRRGLRRRLEFTLVGVALVSVLLLSAINYAFAHVLINNSVETQLTTLLDTRVRALERGGARLQSEVSTLAVTPSVGVALEALSTQFEALDEEMSVEQTADLAATYEEVLSPLRDVGIDIDLDSVMPTSNAGRAVQDLYIANNPYDFDERDRLDDAGDGSGYSAAHAEFHPLLRSLKENARMADLLLVDAESREVVYSVEKRIDIGTNVADGPWSTTALGEVIDELSEVGVGDTVFFDSTFYPPARGEAVIFLASAVRSGPNVIGAVITEVPVAAVTALVTAGQDWELLGLGETGESYIVGEDATLRTDVRQWTDDPQGFLSEHAGRTDDEQITEQISRFGSAVLLQRVDNAAVDAALEGQTFLGNVKNYRGVSTLAAAGPAEIGELQWVVVVEQERGETTAALRSLLRGTLLVMAILLPTTALLGWWMARTLTRPFEDLVQAAAGVARGEPIIGVDELGNNEIGDVGRQLAKVANQLEAEEKAIIAEEERISDVLSAVLPPRLVDRVRSGEQGIDDLVDTASVVAVVVGGVPEATGSDQDTVLEITEQIGDELDELMSRYRMERLRRSASTELFVAGLGDPDARVGDAAAFAEALRSMVIDLGAEYGHELSVRVGLAAGEVATGIVGRSQLTFSAWGDAVSEALTLSSLAQGGQILADADVVDGLDSTWDVESQPDLHGLDEDLEAFVISLPIPSP